MSVTITADDAIQVGAQLIRANGVNNCHDEYRRAVAEMVANLCVENPDPNVVTLAAYAIEGVYTTTKPDEVN